MKRRGSRTPIEAGTRQSAQRPRAAEGTSNSGVSMFEEHDLIAPDDAACILMGISRNEIQRRKHLDRFYKWEKMIVEKPWMLS